MSTPWDPEQLEARDAPAAGELPASSTVGAVHLTVAELDRSVDYYRRVFGLSVLERDGTRASLGIDRRELLGLVESPNAHPAFHHSGLYHFALLLPQRADLARWLAYAAAERIALTGLSDHFVSEAIYLTDPDGHGIEIYWDRPREVWEGQVAARMTTLALDVDSLLGELGDPFGEASGTLPSGTRMGHVHLRVAEIASTVAFYREVIGFGLMAQLDSHAAFLSAGGYHHHLGANTWESAGAPLAPEGTARLLRATIVLPDERERDRVVERVELTGQRVQEIPAGVLVRDPSGIALLLSTS